MKKIKEISNYKVLGYTDKDKAELKDRELAINEKSKKFEFKNVDLKIKNSGDQRLKEFDKLIKGDSFSFIPNGDEPILRKPFN